MITEWRPKKSTRKKTQNIYVLYVKLTFYHPDLLSVEPAYVRRFHDNGSKRCCLVGEFFIFQFIPLATTHSGYFQCKKKKNNSSFK